MNAPSIDIQLSRYWIRYSGLATRAGLAADVDHGGLLADVPRETRAVIAAAGGVADKESSRVLVQRMARVGIFADVMPGEHTAVGNHRAREMIVEKIVR